MLIIEIAIGIVLGFVILAYLPQLLTISAAIVVAAILFALFILLAFGSFTFLDSLTLSSAFVLTLVTLTGLILFYDEAKLKNYLLNATKSSNPIYHKISNSLIKISSINEKTLQLYFLTSLVGIFVVMLFFFYFTGVLNVSA